MEEHTFPKEVRLILFSHKAKSRQPLSLPSSLCGRKNPFIENYAEVSSNLVSGSINVSNLPAIKDDEISNLFLSEFILR